MSTEVALSASTPRTSHIPLEMTIQHDDPLWPHFGDLAVPISSRDASFLSWSPKNGLLDNMEQRSVQHRAIHGPGLHAHTSQTALAHSQHPSRRRSVDCASEEESTVQTGSENFPQRKATPWRDPESPPFTHQCWVNELSALSSHLGHGCCEHRGCFQFFSQCVAHRRQ